MIRRCWNWIVLGIARVTIMGGVTDEDTLRALELRS